MIDWNNRLTTQFDFVKEKIQDIKHNKSNGNLTINYYYFDKEYKLEVTGQITDDFLTVDYIAYSHIINGYL
jgi:hypothetical protein